jgi:putative membrane protein
MTQLMEDNKMISMKAAIVSVGFSLLASMAFAADKISAQDFAATAASSDMFEIRSSELALQKSQTSAVKEFAQMMIKDHTEASKNLMAAAKQDGIAVPGEMAEKHAAQVKALSGAEGEAFDAAYLDAQLAGHKEALALMTNYAKDGDAAALKAHAQKTAPIVQMHLEHVEQLNKNK